VGDRTSARVAVVLGAATVPAGVLQLPQQVIVLRAEVGALEELREHSVLKVVSSRDLTLVPEVL
jgi:hypothetical protein